MPDSINLLPNGGFEVDTTGWAPAQSTLTRSAAQAAHGSWGGQVDATVNAGINHVNTPTADVTPYNAGDNLVGSVYVVGDGAVIGRTYQVRLFAAGGSQAGAQIGASVTFAMPAAMTRVAVTAPLDFSDRTTVRIDVFRFAGTTVNIGDRYYVDAAQLEPGTTPSPYLDTTNGARARKAAEAALVASVTASPDAAASRLRGNAILAAAGAIAAAAWTRQHPELQALEYRRQQQAREDNRAAMEAALVGSQAARDAQYAGWDALRPWRGWEPDRKVKGDPA